KFVVTAIVIWHSIGLGLLSLIALALIPILLGQKIVRIARHVPSPITQSVEAPDWSRREFLRFAGAMLPPAFTFSLTGIAMAQLNNVRIRRFVLPIPELPTEFDGRVKASGIPFLLDESTVITVRGVPVQLLGLSWTRIYGKGRDAAIATSVQRLLEQRVADAFPILMAHHPHAFDAAASAGLPLTLSGHTHGGQLMLNEQLGFGPALFRYWSGLYERGQSKLIVSNGIGNWFPLRLN